MLEGDNEASPLPITEPPLRWQGSFKNGVFGLEVGGDFQVARRLIPTEDTAKFLGGWVVYAVVDL